MAYNHRDGHHLFTLLVSFRALQSGAILAARLNDTGASDFYLSQAGKISARLDDFWDDKQQYYRATLPDIPLSAVGEGQAEIGGFAKRERTGLDCAVPLAIIHGGGRGGQPRTTRC
jgi:glucoamylase